MSALLTVSGLCKSFGAVVVADNLSFEVHPGEALGIVGPNGAGKTTLFNLIAGAQSADSGRIEFDGQLFNRLSSAQRRRKGIARSFQIPQPFGGMSVFENTLVAATTSGGQALTQANKDCFDILERTGLAAKVNVLARDLTLLERKRLELARAMSASPRLILLDEIAGGLSEHECHALVDAVREVQQSGVTIIWIEHVVRALLAVVDRIMVLDFGRKIADGEPQTVMRSQVVREIYMGVEAHA